MSRIDELVERTSPEGVEYRALGEVGEFTRGSGLQKKDFVEDGEPCIHYGQIYTYYGLSATETKSFIEPVLWNRLKKANPNDLIIAITSENVEDVCKAMVWEGEGQVAFGGHSTSYKTDLNSRYVAYWFQTEDFFKQKKKFVKGTKVIEMSPDNMAKIRIPVPPLEVQEEIVRVLDSFTELEVALEAELEAELEARRLQYAHYRDQLLDFSEREDVPWLTLGEVASYARTRVPASSLEVGSYVGVNELLPDYRGRSDEVRQPAEESCIAFEPGDLLLGNIRPYLRKMWLADSSGGTNGDVLVIRVNDPAVVSPEFLHEVLMGEGFTFYNVQNSKGAKMPRGDKKAILNFPIPIPPLSEQQEIVSILDRFDALTTSLTDGLPAEIEARRQQYAYWRDRLLAFPEKPAA